MSTRDFSSQQEKRIAKTFNGKVVANSGATKFNKGDVIVGNILIECKTTTSPKDSFSVKKDWLRKNKEEAFEMGLNYSILTFDFGSGEDYFVIDKKLMQKLAEVLIEKEGK